MIQVKGGEAPGASKRSCGIMLRCIGNSTIEAGAANTVLVESRWHGDV